jgi:hypothetical protein
MENHRAAINYFEYIRELAVKESAEVNIDG